MKSLPARTLHLIDLENLCGCADCTTQMAAEVRSRYLSTVPKTPYDHYVIATSHHNALATTAWPGPQLIVRSGENGAEAALCDYADGLPLAGMYSSIVVASGDHYFAERVASWKSAGIHVTVVGREMHTSAALYKAASAFLPLPGRGSSANTPN